MINSLGFLWRRAVVVVGICRGFRIRVLAASAIAEMFDTRASDSDRSLVGKTRVRECEFAVFEPFVMVIFQFECGGDHFLHSGPRLRSRGSTVYGEDTRAKFHSQERPHCNCDCRRAPRRSKLKSNGYRPRGTRFGCILKNSHEASTLRSTGDAWRTLN